MVSEEVEAIWLTAEERGGRDRQESHCDLAFGDAIRAFENKQLLSAGAWGPY